VSDCCLKPNDNLFSNIKAEEVACQWDDVDVLFIIDQYP
jgi:hypothetical protein